MDPATRWQSLRRELDTFQSHLARGVPRLEVRVGYDVEWSAEEFQEARRDGRYHKPGVYLIYANDGTLLHVGSTTYIFDKQIFRHAIVGARYIDLVPFEERFSYFAAALERFLIGRLRPRANAVGAGYAYE
ncbi:MAG: hypothetical protein U0230_25500 [Polyangiales bacterium]